jgi:predicted PurR-regulated permease PerM
MSRYQWVFAMRRSPDLQRLLIFGLSGPFLALNLWILSQVILYFQHLITVLVIAAILAFLLNYPVRIIERFYRSRSQAVIVVLLFTFALLVVLGFTLVPIVINQTTELLKNIPAWLDASNDNLTRLTDWTRDRRLPIDFRAISKSVNARIESQLQVLATQVLGFALGTLTGLLDTILVIVLAFYMLLYGKKLWLGIVSLLPPQIGLPLSESLRLNFQNFFISQILLALFMFGTLTPIFLIMGVQFALLFALLIGMAEVIPFIGATLGIGLVTILLMLNSFWLAMRVAIAAIIMQQIKDNLLAPRLMGEFIGLNPILIFIALLVGAQLAGVLGVIIAVPIAGTIKGTIDAIRLLRQTQAIATEPVSAEPSNPVRPEEGYEKEKS